MQGMRRFIEHQRDRIWMKSLTPSIVICIFLYIIIRCLSFDFPMSWKEECFFFGKIVFSGCSMIVLSVTAGHLIYKAALKLKRSKNTA